MLVQNLSTDESLIFAETSTMLNVVCYAYCIEHNLTNQFIKADLENELDAFYKTLPITTGGISIACGDWCAM